MLKRGFKGVTISDIADKAHVGRGTLYLYWPNKESLFLALLARDSLEGLEHVIGALREDPQLLRPDRLCPWLVRAGLKQPLAHALQTIDTDVLGGLAQSPQAKEMARNQGMMALLSHLLVVWREHQMVRTDWSAEEQAYALQVVGVGFQETLTRWSVFSDLDEEARSATLSASLIEILGVRDVPEPDLRTAVAEAVHIIEVMCSRLRELMDELTGHDATAG